MAVWNSSHCLDDDTGNATNLQMWSCTGGPGWYEVYQNVADGWCLRTNSVAPRTNPEMWPCDASVNYERWEFK
jgi:hypothetical protein